MAGLLITSVAVGVLLGLRLKVLVLIPSSLLTMAIIAAAGVAGRQEFWTVAPLIAGAMALHQLGYMTGCVMQVPSPAHPPAGSAVHLRSADY